jgi:site-specific DNA-cytosine methylase
MSISSSQRLLMENVQGMLWTSPAGTMQLRHNTMADYVARRLAGIGYLIFPKILDAARYGVPQHRSRLFVLGIHRDLGYALDDFGEHGPFPHPTNGPGTDYPYITVRDAIADLPAVGNGALDVEVRYTAPPDADLRANAFLRRMRAQASPNVIFDHVTSRHADYVIQRYRRIPPGGNWQDIMEMMTNYTAIDRTHSNIYRRLKWDETSITIGDYRKSMIVHPAQHRGLSVREAARLQSFPDWYRFSGGPNGSEGGIMHKQKQLANAVCPLVTQALAEFILLL